MSRSPKVLIPEEPYVRTREDPFFNGLLRGGADSRRKRSPILDQLPGSREMSRSVSDIGDVRRKTMVHDVSELPMELPDKNAVASDIGTQPSRRKLSWISKTASFPLRGSDIDLPFDPADEMDVIEQQSSPVKSAVAAADNSIVCCSPDEPVRPAIERSYSVCSGKLKDIPGISLSLSAATFYNGLSPRFEIVESCESIRKLNVYLNARRDDVNAGVPGKFLHAVIGQESPDIGSIASTITYAFYLNETLDNDQLCTVPVLNMKREDLNSRAELKWLLDSCQIDESSLLFVDEVDLSYYDLFGSLKLVLMNGDKIPTKQQMSNLSLKESVVEIFNSTKDPSSCCSIIAEKIAQTRPELLAGHGFTRLLLSGILMDTSNLSSPHCTITDNYMVALLINGAGRFGLDGIYQILRHKMCDASSNLKMVDILRKDFKKWTRPGKSNSTSSRSMPSSVGMSSVGLSVDHLLAHGNDATENIRYFLRLEKLCLLVILSGFYDSQKNFKREVLVSGESMQATKSLHQFLRSNASYIPLTILQKPGLRDDMMVFEIDKLASRRTIERLVEEFGGASKW